MLLKPFLLSRTMPTPMRDTLNLQKNNACPIISPPTQKIQEVNIWHKVAKKHLKKWSTSLVSWKMRVKTSMSIAEQLRLRADREGLQTNGLRSKWNLSGASDDPLHSLSKGRTAVNRWDLVGRLQAGTADLMMVTHVLLWLEYTSMWQWKIHPPCWVRTFWQGPLRVSHVPLSSLSPRCCE